MNQDIYKVMKQFNEYYKEYFGKTKDTNFMLKTKEKIFKLPQTSFVVNNVFDLVGLSIEKMMLGIDNHDFEIAKNIYMIHMEWIEHLSDIDKGQIREDASHIEKVMGQTLVHLNIRKYGTKLVRKEHYQSYKPSIYSLRALVSYTSELVRDNQQNLNVMNKDFFITMIIKIINKAVACLSLIDINLHEEAFSQLRSLTELYMIYLLIVTEKEKVIKEYTRFVDMGFEYNQTQELPNEIKKKNITNKMDYLNFGWLDSIDNYGYIEPKKYKLSDVAELLDLELINGKKSNFGKTLYGIYKDCNPLTHGTNKLINNKMAEKVLIDRLGIIFHNIAYDIRELTSNSFVFNNVDLIEYFLAGQSLNRIKLKVYDKYLEKLKLNNLK